MRKLILTAGLASLVVSHAYAGAPACMTADDLSWSPSIARAISTIDVDHKGCVTGDQIARYRAAVKEVRATMKEQVAALLAGKKD